MGWPEGYLGLVEGSFRLLREQGGNVAAAVNDLHNSDAGVGDAVEDEILFSAM